MDEAALIAQPYLELYERLYAEVNLEMKSIIWKILKFSSSKDIFLFLKKFYDKIFRPTRTEPPTFPQRTRLLSSKRATLMYSCWDRLEFFSDKKLTFLFRFGNWATETGEAHWTERNSSSRSNSLPRRSKVQFIYYYFLKTAPLKSLLQMRNDRKRSFQIREEKLKNWKILNNNKKEKQ